MAQRVMGDGGWRRDGCSFGFSDSGVDVSPLAGVPMAQAKAALAGGAPLILAFFHEGIIGVGLASLGARASPPAEPSLRAGRPRHSPLP